MDLNTEIKDFSAKWGQLIGNLSKLSCKEQSIPGSIDYSIMRLLRSENEPLEDTGVVHYEYKGKEDDGNKLKLRFCVAGNMYCNNTNCQKCPVGNAKNCNNSVPCFDVVYVDYAAAQLSQFTNGRTTHATSDTLLSFNKKESFHKIIPLCCKTRGVIEALVSHKYTGSLENIYVNAQLQMLLLYSMDWVADKEEILSCRFLNSETDCEKIMQARDILIQNIGQPITIKELSRKVAMNECYLKKGFKEMHGTTIFEFYQHQRMEHAKYLLYEKGLNVTDVSVLLGYSSISHFSTAFKKQTGLKPCELLLR